MKEYFYEKNKTRKENFKDDKVDPIEILNKLVERPTTTFKLPPITIKETHKIITSLKTSNTAGADGISSRFLKEIPTIASHHITFMINTIIRTGVYPECLKISRILPLRKKGKCPLDRSSLRRIHNLFLAGPPLVGPALDLHLCVCPSVCPCVHPCVVS